MDGLSIAYQPFTMIANSAPIARVYTQQHAYTFEDREVSRDAQYHIMNNRLHIALFGDSSAFSEKNYHCCRVLNITIPNNCL